MSCLIVLFLIILDILPFLKLNPSTIKAYLIKSIAVSLIKGLLLKNACSNLFRTSSEL